MVEMNSGGGIRVHFRFGQERLQVNTKIPREIDLANGQPHIIRFRRENGRRMILQVSVVIAEVVCQYYHGFIVVIDGMIQSTGFYHVQVDDYEPITDKDFSDLLPPTADVFLNVRYILIGRNMCKCISVYDRLLRIYHYGNNSILSY